MIISNIFITDNSQNIPITKVKLQPSTYADVVIMCVLCVYVLFVLACCATLRLISATYSS